MKAKIKKIQVSMLIDVLLEVEKLGIEYVDIEVKHVSPDLDKIKIIAYEPIQLTQESPKITFDDKNINDIIAWS
jgi:hypothetical protein